MMPRRSRSSTFGTPVPDPNRSMMQETQQRRYTSYNGELSHPLHGEYIDDPNDVPGGSYNSLRSSMSNISMPHQYSRSLSNPMIPSTRISAHTLETMSPFGTIPQYSGPMDHPHQHQGSGMSGSSNPRVVYNVKFKRTQRSFVLGARAPRDLKVGSYVKVEADRGEDLGMIVSKAPSDKYGKVIHRGMGGSPGSNLGFGDLPTAGMGGSGPGDLKKIIRLATNDEVSLLTVTREEEAELLKICRSKVRQRGLAMHVVDAEYQFDRHKLTFFFEAEGRIDFRELVRDLFSMYKTRIWMQQLDKNGSGSSSAANVFGVPQNDNGALMGVQQQQAPPPQAQHRQSQGPSHFHQQMLSNLGHDFGDDHHLPGYNL